MLQLRYFKCRQGFTLIELLVVIAIVGLLAAILFPVFARARDRARVTTCASNLRQIGAAIQMYVRDHDSYYPKTNHVDTDCTWVDTVYPYAKSAQIFRCPTFKNYDDFGEYRPGCEETGDVYGDPHYNGSYTMNTPNIELTLAPSAHIVIHPKTVHESQYLSPANTILLLDGNGDQYAAVNPGFNTITGASDLSNRGIILRHSDGNNVAFADGHVKWMGLGALTRRNLWTLDGAD